LHSRKNFRSEMQARGWRRYRTASVCVNRLVAVPILEAVGPVYIGRQGHVSQALNHAEEIYRRLKPYSAFAKIASGYDFRLQFVVVSFRPVSKKQFFSYSNLPAWADQALPFVWIPRYLPGEQHLDAPLEKIASRRIP
jgi:hypothetical protein